MGKNEERKNEQCGVHEKSIDSFAGCFVYTNVELSMFIFLNSFNEIRK